MKLNVSVYTGKLIKFQGWRLHESGSFPMAQLKQSWQYWPQPNYRPQTKLREAKVFTGVCLFTGGCLPCGGWGCLSGGGVYPGAGVYTPPPPPDTVNRRSVPILL